MRLGSRCGTENLLFAAHRRFKFQKRRQLFICMHNETLSVVAVCVCNPDRSSFKYRKLRPSPSSNSLCLRLSSDYFPNASSCRAYADEEFGPETLQMEAFRLHY